MTRRVATAGESPFLLEALERAGDLTATLEAPEQESPAFEWEAKLEPASTIDAKAAEPAFADALRKRQFPLLDAAALKTAVSFNEKQHPKVSEIQLIHLCDRLEVYVDREGLLKTMGGQPTLGELVAQMAQQFQRKCFREERFHTGKLDEPTLDALGFVRHRGRDLNKADQKNTAATAILKRALTGTLTEPLGTDVSAANWFSFMLDAPFLGLTTRGGTGLHLELMRRLRTAQRWLWQWARYRDLSPVELGDALLWDPADDSVPHGDDWTRPTDPDKQLGDRHRGARPGTPGASMHLPGLAVDLAYRANPWVGSLSFKEVSGRAATLVGGSVIDASGTRTRAAAAVGELSDAPGLGRRALHTLAQGTRTTAQIYDTLAQWNAWLERYLALGADDAGLRDAIAARQADGTPGVVRPDGNLDRTLADWRGQIRRDLENLRKNSFSAAGTPRDPRKGFLSFHRDLVCALRDIACLAWGAVDIGQGEQGSGDMMHFDCRVDGIGRAFATATGQSAIPQRHPCIAAVQVQREAAPVMEFDLKPQPTPATVTGKLFRLDSKQGGSATGVFVPPAAMTKSPLKVLLWMHGLSRRRDDKKPECKDAKFSDKPKCFPFICGNADDAFQHLKDPTFSLMKLVEASGQPFILVVPSMRWSGDSHKLDTPKQMNLFLNEVQTFLEDVRLQIKKDGLTGWNEKAPIGELVLAGHSKAYVVLDGLACRVDDAESSQDPLAKLNAVWSIDTMYGQATCASAKWVSWAAIKTNVKFRVVYRSISLTGPEGDRLARKATQTGLDKKNLKVVAIPSSTVTHCDLPAKQLPSLLAGGDIGPLQEELEAFEAEAYPREQYDTPPRGKTAPPPVVDPPGKTLYVDALVHPNPVKSKVGVFLPEKFRPSASVDLLVFLHGFLGPCKSPKPSIAEFWNTGRATAGAALGIGPMGLREELNLSGKNVILVVPSLGDFSTAGALTAPGGFDALISSALQVIRDEASLKITPSLVRHIVLAGHSGGGAPMRDIVALKDHAVRRIRRVWGFDAMNGDRDPKAWLEWAKAEPDPALRRVFQYYADTWADTKKTIKVGTWRRAEQLAKLADTEGLKNVHAKKAAGRNHCELPLLFLKDRLKASKFFDDV